MYFAHSTGDLSRRDWQVLRDHLSGVAALAAQFAHSFGAERAAYLAGLLHDLGKYTKGFQARLEGGNRVDHATAGAFEIRRLGRNTDERLFAEILAYGIAGHHAGLPDKTGSGSLADRLQEFPSREPLDPVWQTEIAPDIVSVAPKLKYEKENLSFQLGVLGRMIFSCLVDADYRDTENFYAKVEGRRIDRNWPTLGDRIDALVTAFDAHMVDMQSRASDTSINALRRDILAQVRAKAFLPPGIFTLTVPTGGGKTLASLGFALDHAKHHGLERIIYTIPFTAIIDQTATVFRDVLGGDVLLEHHSAIEEEKNEQRESRDKLKLAMEDWAAPVVVTTNVQFFESLFADRPSRCRKLHNIARSVVILDEAQTIPLTLLRPCVAMLGELAYNYGVSVVLCTATQPALAAPDFAGGLKLTPDRELAPDPHHLAQVLRRVRIWHSGEMDDAALVDAIAAHKQGLVIVNSRAHALTLFHQAKDAGLTGVIHLTTRQCAAHRRTILADIRGRLCGGEACRVIATSLVEAGVDLDFPRVWRAEAGLDQIAQAAGRCNREREREADDSIVTIFRAPANPPPHEIRQFADAFTRMAEKYEDWLSPDALCAYFREIYWVKGDALDKKRILGQFRMDKTGTDFAYRTVAENFRMIESGLVPVIIGWDRIARDTIAKLDIPGMPPGGLARTLQPYVVQVPPKARALLIGNGHVVFGGERNFGDQFAVLNSSNLYIEDAGLMWENGEYLEIEQSIL